MSKMKKYLFSAAAMLVIVPLAIGFSACKKKTVEEEKPVTPTPVVSTLNLVRYVGIEEGAVLSELGAGQSITKIAGEVIDGKHVFELATAPSAANKDQIEVGFDAYFTANSITYSDATGWFTRKTNGTADEGAALFHEDSRGGAGLGGVVLDKTFGYIKTSAVQALAAGATLETVYTFGTGASAKSITVVIKVKAAA
jgi:hypothetical protein